MDRALLSASALLLNAVFGGPRSWYTALGADRIAAYPVRVLRELERKLNREQRSPEDRETRGQLLVAVVLAAGIIGGLILGADAVVEAFASQFADPDFVTYVRTPETVELDELGERAAEHGRWVADWKGSAMAGSYLAVWRKTLGQWVIESELYVTLS